MSNQLSLPGMPRRKTRVRVAKETPVDRIVNRYNALRGPIVHWGKARRLAKQILDAEYSVEEVLACIQWLHEDKRFCELGWSLAFVGTKLPEFRKTGGRESVICAEVVEVPDGWTR